MSIHPAFRRCGAIWAIALVSLVSGCVPTTWLPDSSGFIYVKTYKPKNEQDPPLIQVNHFDLKKKTSRVVVDNLVSDTNWPAVSPDGKHIATARFAKGVKDERTVQVVIHDLSGKVVQQSKPLKWHNHDAYNHLPSLLFWSPKQDRIVITNMVFTGYYIVKTDTMLELPGCAMPLIHGGTPIRPDGAGCLLLLESPDELVFMDWQGNRQPIDTAPLKAILKWRGSEGIFHQLLLRTPLEMPSWWQGNTAVVGSRRSGATIRYDSLKKTVSFPLAIKNNDALNEMLSDKRVAYDFANRTSIDLVRFTEGNLDGANEYTRVIAVDHKTGKERMVLAKEGRTAFAVHSPDGRFLAVSFYYSEDLPRTIVIINDSGELVARLEMGS